MFQYFYPYRAQAPRHIIPRAPLRLPWAMNFCLFEAYPSDRMSSPVMWHTTSSYFPPAKNPCRSAAPTARSVLLTSSPHGICAYLRDPWEKYFRDAWPIPHPTLHILNIPPPNLHCFSHPAPPRVQIRHSRAFM